MILDIQDGLVLLVSLALFAAEAWAFVDALSRRPEVYVAADKQTKTMWLVVLGVALVAHLLIPSPFSLLNLLGAVAAIVYLVDARPVLQSLSRR